jgi:SAM-dependent methyltransferase
VAETPDPDHPSAPPAGGDRVARRALRRRVRAVRRRLGPGPYLHAGCGDGALLAALARHGSVSGVEPDPVTAEVARRTAPGCPVHHTLDAFPSGIFRGVIVDRPSGAAGDLARVLAPGGRVLLIGDLPVPAGLTVLREGRESRLSGAPVRLLGGMIGE